MDQKAQQHALWIHPSSVLGWSTDSTLSMTTRLFSLTYPEKSLAGRFYQTWTVLMAECGSVCAPKTLDTHLRIRFDTGFCTETAKLELQKLHQSSSVSSSSSALSVLPASGVGLELQLRQPPLNRALDADECVALSLYTELCGSQWTSASKLNCATRRECVPNKRGFACVCTSLAVIEA